jgi:hypothetical protein
MSQSTEQWTWKDPPFGVLQYDYDCDSATDYYANRILVVNAGDFLDLNNSKAGDLGYLLSYLASVLPNDWDHISETNVSDFSIIEGLFGWYLEVWNNDTYYSSLSSDNQTAYLNFFGNSSQFAYSCDNQSICNKLDIKGDPDVSGRGVSNSLLHDHNNCSC